MQVKLPTIDIRMRKVDVPTPDRDRTVKDVRGKASGWRGVAVDRAGDLRDIAMDRASDIKDFVAERATEVRDFAAERAGDVRDLAVDRAGDVRDAAAGAASGGASALRDAATGGASAVRDAAAGGASTVRDAAAGLVSGARDAAAAGASDARDAAAGRVSGALDRAGDLKLPDVKLPDVKLPDIDLSNVDLGKAIAPATKAVGDGINAVTSGLRSIGRSIEERRKPRRQPHLAEAGAALLAGIGGGMALMFFLDPAKGRRRRMVLRAKLDRWSRAAASAAQGTQRQLAARGQGMVAGIASMTRNDTPESDAEAQLGVLAGPDASAELQDVDAAAGRTSDTWSPSSTTGDSFAADAAADQTLDASPEGYSQAWGERASGDGTTADAEERDRIGSASEN